MSDPASAAAEEATAQLALKLRALRADRKISQQDTANQAGMNLRNYQRIESNSASSTTERRKSGSSNPRLDTIFKLAYVLEIDVSYLIDPEQPVQPVPPRRSRTIS